jgi:hypothetical protein
VNERTDDATLRPDGSHFDFEHAQAAGDEFARMVVEAYRSCSAGTTPTE